MLASPGSGRRGPSWHQLGGSAISFIFPDLVTLPILVIYRRYYGTRMMAFLATSFHVLP